MFIRGTEAYKKAKTLEKKQVSFNNTPKEPRNRDVSKTKETPAILSTIDAYDSEKEVHGIKRERPRINLFPTFEDRRMSMPPVLGTLNKLHEIKTT